MKVLFLPNIIEKYMNKSKSKFESGKELYKLGYYGDSIIVHNLTFIND